MVIHQAVYHFWTTRFHSSNQDLLGSFCLYTSLENKTSQSQEPISSVLISKMTGQQFTSQLIQRTMACLANIRSAIWSLVAQQAVHFLVTVETRRVLNWLCQQQGLKISQFLLGAFVKLPGSIILVRINFISEKITHFSLIAESKSVIFWN